MTWLVLSFTSFLRVGVKQQQMSPEPATRKWQRSCEPLGRGVMADGSSPTPAVAALNQFEIREGLDLELMAAEPNVEQPLFISWDSVDACG